MFIKVTRKYYNTFSQKSEWTSCLVNVAFIQMVSQVYDQGADGCWSDDCAEISINNGDVIYDMLVGEDYQTVCELIREATGK